jgi:hypothetical protein
MSFDAAASSSSPMMPRVNSTTSGGSRSREGSLNSTSVAALLQAAGRTLAEDPVDETEMHTVSLHKSKPVSSCHSPEWDEMCYVTNVTGFDKIALTVVLADIISGTETFLGQVGCTAKVRYYGIKRTASATICAVD